MWNHQKHCRYDNWEEHDNNTKKQRGLRRGGLSNGCGAKKQGAEWGGGGKEGCKQVNGEAEGGGEPVGGQARDPSGDTRSNSRHE